MKPCGNATLLSGVGAAIALLLSYCAAANEHDAAETVASSQGVTGTLFVANKRGNTLSKIDLASGREVLRRIATGKGGDGLAILP